MVVLLTTTNIMGTHLVKCVDTLKSEWWEMVLLSQLAAISGIKSPKHKMKIDSALSESHKDICGITVLSQNHYWVGLQYRLITQWANPDVLRTQGEHRVRSWNWASVWRPLYHVIIAYPWTLTNQDTFLTAQEVNIPVVSAGIWKMKTTGS